MTTAKKENEKKARISITLSQEIADEIRTLHEETKIPLSELVEIHFTNPAKYALLIRDFMGETNRIENKEILKTVEKLLLTMGVNKEIITESIEKIKNNIE